MLVLQGLNLLSIHLLSLWEFLIHSLDLTGVLHFDWGWWFDLAFVFFNSRKISWLFRRELRLEPKNSFLVVLLQGLNLCHEGVNVFNFFRFLLLLHLFLMVEALNLHWVLSFLLIKFRFEFLDFKQWLFVDGLTLRRNSDIESIDLRGKRSILLFEHHNLAHELGMSLLIIGILGYQSFIILVDNLGLWNLIVSHLLFKVLQFGIFAFKVADLVLQLLDFWRMLKLDLRFLWVEGLYLLNVLSHDILIHALHLVELGFVLGFDLVCHRWMHVNLCDLVVFVLLFLIDSLNFNKLLWVSLLEIYKLALVLLNLLLVLFLPLRQL